LALCPDSLNYQMVDRRRFHLPTYRNFLATVRVLARPAVASFFTPIVRPSPYRVIVKAEKIAEMRKQ
jgi:hypothetical protein